MHPLTSLGGVALLVLALAGGVQAAAVSYDFSVAGGAGVGKGSFTFDDSSGAVNAFSEAEFELTAFSFSFGGKGFGLADLDAALRVVVFDGSQLLGLDLARTGAFRFVPSMAGADAYLVDGQGHATSTLSFSLRPGQVLPEPGTGSLVLLAVAAGWAGRGRATARR